MKYQKFFFLALIIALLLIVLGLKEEAEIGKVEFTLGEVNISHNGGSDWEQANISAKVYSGDIARTGQESRCEFILKDNSLIRIGENSQFSFEGVEMKSGRLSGSAKLASGSIWSNLQKLKSGDKAISVKTPTSVMAVRGTIFRADAEADSSTSVLVYDGAVDVRLSQEVENKILLEEKLKPGPPKKVPGPKQVPGPYEVTLKDWMRIVAGMQINIRNDGKYYSFKFDAQQDEENEWVKWNKERDLMSLKNE